MRFHTRRRVLRVLSWWVLVAQVATLSPLAYANPRGGVVVGGSAAIDQANPSVTAVRQLTDRAVINWQGFSNRVGESIRFQQPGVTSSMLNRVTGNEMSVINGAMSANGRIFLINPNGALFGKMAEINTGGLVASTLNMKDADFMAGRYRFQQDPNKPLRAVVNQGNIRTTPGGRVALIAPVVNNEATITAPGGEVALAAGNQAVVTLDAEGLVEVGVNDGAPGAVIVSQDQASSMLQQAVNTKHVVHTGGVRVVGNDVVLDRAEGLAMNQGRINVDAVGAGSNAGRVRIEGTRASLATIGSLITANGVGLNSRGGDVRLYSRGNTIFAPGARIEARGGETGAGGFVEVSGHGNLVVAGDVSTVGASGEGGTFLIDPDDIIVSDGPAPQGQDDLDLALSGGATNGLPDDDSTLLFGDVPPAMTISEGRLEQLAFDGNDVILQANNSITISDLTDNLLNLATGTGGSITLLAGAGGICNSCESSTKAFETPIGDGWEAPDSETASSSHDRSAVSRNEFGRSIGSVGLSRRVAAYAPVRLTPMRRAASR